ncbi:MAG TPA: amidohydrolase family protein [candidate division Zixibacteria bacterium]|nr:amidohydrolase family protein [candidate division Zixibacteria bacterium]
MIVDFQHHYVPADLAKKRGLYSEQVVFAKDGAVPSLTMHSKLYDPEAQLADMDEAGVDVSVISCLLGWSAPLEDCRFINEKLAELQAKYPGRFVGLAQAPVLEGKAALDELDRAVRKLGLKGVTVTSQIQGLPLDSPNLDAFYGKVSELDVPIFVHPAMVPKGYELINDYDLARILGREMDLALAATRIIAGGVLDRFPGLKFVIGHFGGGISSVKDRLVAKAYRFGTLKKPFEEYFDMLYFDLAGFEGGLAALRCALLGIKPERLVFATDYPQDFTGVSTATGRGMKALREYIQAIRALDLSEDLKEGILGKTASGLLKL